ncbi:family 43 glycosylhydrolase [Rhodanobacter sp. L36]|uniref:family 43 glycosylhydrolase n=1 Tax=Rhodanobacter sp. L36 TaxID=1747221 RepID=UPI0020B171D1|nr:family 43 glycosylhydrolase [Rhodanobacter sp. L36]
MRWPQGVEGQRKADRGDGTYLNPIFAGDHPDPSILKDGRDYYMIFSTFDAYPGLTIHHSLDLVNWRPVIAPLTTPIGSVWASNLCRHEGRYCIYISNAGAYRSIFVIHADRIDGPWSEPVDLKITDHIDPCHTIDEAGRRWLFLSGGDRVPLAPDGLSTVGKVEHVYDPWRYPANWSVETFAAEGPKVFRRNDWFYLVSAVGGTAGPPTGHMVVVARARSLAGPWEQDPGNPVVKTWSAAEKWWSRGHATPFEGPDGDWWMIYHGYENGYWTLGRQTLLEPIVWNSDGWFRPKGGDLSKPLRKPRGAPAGPHGQALSDDFRSPRWGTQWSFYDPGQNEQARARFANRTLHLRAKGHSPADASPLTFIAGDQRYEMVVEIEVDEGAEAGLLVFYNRRLYAGLGINASGSVMHRFGQSQSGNTLPNIARRGFIRLRNDRNAVVLSTSPDGLTWSKYDLEMETSGYHQNVAGDFLSLRPAIYCSGRGEARFRDFHYRAET